MLKPPFENPLPFSVIALMLGILTVVLLSPISFAKDVEVLKVSNQTLHLEVNQSRLIRLQKPAGGVFIANPEIADITVQSPTLLHVVARHPGETSLYAVDDGDRVLMSLRLISTHNLPSLEEAFRAALPMSRIEVTTAGTTLIVSGEVATPDDAAEAMRLANAFAGSHDSTRIINRLNVLGATQVNLRVRIAEMSRDVIKNLGIGLDVLTASGNFAFGIGTGLSVPSAIAENIIGATFAAGATQIDATLDILEEDGLITVLAEPNLTALSGETASFLAGGEFPIPIATDEDTISVEFKDFGVSLAFTPTVLNNDRINLYVRPEVSALTEVGAITVNDLVIPALTTRRAETSVELGSGQSLAIAGLIDSRTSTAVSEFPGLSKLPVIGALFRSSQFQRQETELVILVTPYLVRPRPAHMMALPGENFRPPSDLGRYLLGDMWHRRAASPVPDTQTAQVGPDNHMKTSEGIKRGAQSIGSPMGFLLE